MTRTTTLALVLSLFTVAACGADGSGSGGGMVQVDPPTVGFGGGTGDTGAADTGAADPGDCTATDLCLRSIDDCGVNLDLATCEDWYASMGTCRDMDAYLACNCDCEAEEDTCDGYFACGEFCFVEHCQ